MSNVLSTDKKQQVISLGKLGWSLRRIEEATGVRRETASVYLKAGGEALERSVRKLRGPQRGEAVGIILTAPGEEAQVDYGSGPMVRDPTTGKYRLTRLCVLFLGYSRQSVRLLLCRSSTRIWAELHE